MIDSQDPNDDRQVDTHDKHDRTLTGVIHSFPKKVLYTTLTAVAVAAVLAMFWFTVEAVSDKAGQYIAEKQQLASKNDLVIYIKKEDLINFVTEKELVTKPALDAQIRTIREQFVAQGADIRKETFEQIQKLKAENNHRQEEILTAIRGIK